MPGSIQLTVLREILRYVPQFRGKTFVIALDGEIVASEALLTLLRDVALLVSLNIRSVLIADLRHEALRLAERLGYPIESATFDGPLDDRAFDLLLRAAGAVQNRVLTGLDTVDLPGVVVSAFVAHAAGIRGGIDWGHAGKVDRVRSGLIERLLQQDLLPLVLPLASDGDGHTYVVPYVAAAATLAVALRSSKLLYVLPFDGLVLDGALVRQIPLPQLDQILQRPDVPDEVRGYLEHALEACRRGVERVHLVNGYREQGLLAEVFSTEGVGTLVHRDEYAAIRPATRKDAVAIYRLLLPAIEREEVLPRTLTEIQGMLDRFLVYDLDGNVIGCVAVLPYPGGNQVEIACLAVDPAHENQGIGRRLVERALDVARRQGARQAFALSTQTYNYFRNKLGFEDASADDLPPDRRRLLERTARRSRVLKRELTGGDSADEQIR